MPATRRLAAAVLAGTLLLGAAACSDDDPAPKADRTTTTEASASTVDATPIGDFTSARGQARTYYLVPEGTTKRQLIALAERLHAEKPDEELFFMDDDSKIDLILRELPKTEKGDIAGWPADHVVEHTLANVSQYYVNGDLKWAVAEGPSAISTADSWKVLAG